MISQGSRMLGRRLLSLTTREHKTTSTNSKKMKLRSAFEKTKKGFKICSGKKA